MGSISTSSKDSNKLHDFIKARASSLGFCLCGITDSMPLEHFPNYQDWINKNYHGEMKYLAADRHLLPRSDPKLVVPWVKSIVVVAWPYPLIHSKLQEPAGLIAGYVGSKDYHLLLPCKLNELVDDLRRLRTLPLQAKIFCDSGPILERELAVRAGLGWIGRNSCLISPQYGSAFLLAEVFLDVDLPVDSPFNRNYCGTCQRCRQTCPTGCIQPNCNIDARKCISTLTIENKSTIPIELSNQVGTHVYGCDDCQSVCPWNRSVFTGTPEYAKLDKQKLLAELSLSEEKFKQKYASSPILRAKRRGWIRNICVVIANLKIQESFVPLTKLLLTDHDPLCRVAAACSLAAVDHDQAVPLLQEALNNELDPLVLRELNRLLN
jgi:epoxyqueuosine reductase